MDLKKLKVYRIYYFIEGVLPGGIEIIACNKNEALTNAYQYLLKDLKKGFKKKDLSVGRCFRYINEHGVFSHTSRSKYFGDNDEHV